MSADSDEKDDLLIIAAWLDGDAAAGPSCRRRAVQQPELAALARDQLRMHLLLRARFHGPAAAVVAERARRLANDNRSRHERAQRIARAAWRRPHRNLTPWRIAAAILIASGIALGLAWPRLSAVGQIETADPGGIVRRGSATLPAVAGQRLRGGDVLATGQGHIAMRLRDGSAMVLAADGRLAIESAQAWCLGGAKHLALPWGELTCDVAPQPAGEAMHITTPHATAMVVGTRFSLASNAGSTRLAVEHGLVRLTSRAGAAIDVGQDRTAEVTAGYAMISGIRAGSAADALVGHWDFDELRGLQAVDRSGHGHTGVLHGGTSRIPGRLGGGLALDGSGFVSIPHTPALDLEASRDAFTLSVWIRSTHGGLILSKGRSSGRLVHLAWVLQATTAGPTCTLAFWRWHDGGDARSMQGLTRMSASSSTVMDGAWHHLAIVITGPRERSLYQDGALLATDTSLWAEDCRNEEPIELGRYANEPYQKPGFFPGDVDDLRIYRRALAADEITRLAHPAVTEAP